ncbi:unnamed protein product [Alopecurus aequalis]
MRRRAGGTGSLPLPDTLSLVALLLLLLLLATELGTGVRRCKALKADVVVAAVAAAAPKGCGRALQKGPAAAASATGEAGGAVYDASKRMVPQGPNPLHN